MTTTTRDRPLWRGMATQAEPSGTGRPNRPRDGDRSHQATLPVFVEASRTGTAAGVQASREGLANQGGVLRSRDVVEVLHRRLNVGVAHPLLDSPDVGDTDDSGSEGVAEVVEAEWTECCPLER